MRGARRRGERLRAASVGPVRPGGVTDADAGGRGRPDRRRRPARCCGRGACRCGLTTLEPGAPATSERPGRWGERRRKHPSAHRAGGCPPRRPSRRCPGAGSCPVARPSAACRAARAAGGVLLDCGGISAAQGESRPAARWPGSWSRAPGSGRSPAPCRSPVRLSSGRSGRRSCAVLRLSPGQPGSPRDSLHTAGLYARSEKDMTGLNVLCAGTVRSRARCLSGSDRGVLERVYAGPTT